MHCVESNNHVYIFEFLCHRDFFHHRDLLLLLIPDLSLVLIQSYINCAMPRNSRLLDALALMLSINLTTFCIASIVDRPILNQNSCLCRSFTSAYRGRKGRSIRNSAISRSIRFPRTSSRQRVLIGLNLDEPDFSMSTSLAVFHSLGINHPQ